MKVIKKVQPKRAQGDPALVYVIGNSEMFLNQNTSASIRALAELVPTVWAVVLDNKGNTSSVANSLNLGGAGVILASQGDLTRRFYRWASGTKPFLLVPSDMARELDEVGARFAGLLAVDATNVVEKVVIVQQRARKAVQEMGVTRNSSPLANTSLTLFDIMKPTKRAMSEFLTKWSATSLMRPAMIQMLNEASDLYRIPRDVLIQLTKWEYYGLTKSVYKSNVRGGAGNSYVGPFQIGDSHYRDTRNIMGPAFGVKFPSYRGSASLGQQVVSIIDYVRRAANASGTLKRSPLRAVGFYLVHNQGPGGAVRIINNQIDATTKKNLECQSDEVKAALREAYGITIRAYNPCKGR